MSRFDAASLIARLRRRGLTERADAVGELDRAVAALERPAGIVGRLTAAARGEAARQWRLALEEWGESRDALRLMRERARGRALTPDEVDAVRGQALDLVRTVPAGVLAAASALVPLPGFMLLTPWMLRRLDLLPSRWREEALLDRLQREAHRLRESGEEAGAMHLAAVAEDLEDRSERREELARAAALRTHWDLDGDGRISDGERTAYDAEVARLVAVAASGGARRRWFLMLGGDVFGPLRWVETAAPDASLRLLVCLDGESGWVRLADVRRGGGDTSADAGP